jgi:hypothetical protein
VATGFQTYKNVNYLSNWEKVSVAMYSCKRCGRKRKESFEVSDLSLVGCDTVSRGKRLHSAGEYCLHTQFQTVKQ